jgi:DNA-binding CsgD family transcriptional regulator
MDFLRKTIRLLFKQFRFRQGANLFTLDPSVAAGVQKLAASSERSEEEVIAGLLSFALAHRQAAEKDLTRWYSLTPREQQVVALICIGLTYAQAGEWLGISYETVKVHMYHALEKFELRSRFDLRQALAGWDFSTWVKQNIPD